MQWHKGFESTLLTHKYVKRDDLNQFERQAVDECITTVQEHRDEAAREMLEVQAAFLYILEKTGKHPEVRLSSLSKKMRKMLNVEDLATLKNKLVESPLQSNGFQGV
ncbi:hypothetical protein [Shewanella frigidimarina]